MKLEEEIFISPVDMVSEPNIFFCENFYTALIVVFPFVLSTILVGLHYWFSLISYQPSLLVPSHYPTCLKSLTPKPWPSHMTSLIQMICKFSSNPTNWMAKIIWSGLNWFVPERQRKNSTYCHKRAKAWWPKFCYVGWRFYDYVLVVEPHDTRNQWHMHVPKFSEGHLGCITTNLLQS